MEALEYSFEENPMMRAGQLVRCLDTGHLGVVIEKKRSSLGFLILVQWGNDEKVWTLSSDLEAIESD